MRVIFGSWKYLFKNIWYVLCYAILPAVFFALSLDYKSIHSFLDAFFAGTPSVSFLQIFSVFSFIRIDSWLGALYGVGLILSIAFFSSIMLSLVEKHMRIGKRTASGAFRQLPNIFVSSLLITLLYAFIYEVWCVVLAAICYAFGSIIKVTIGVYVVWIACFIVLLSVLLYVVTVFYLWLPCLQITGFSPYEALRYSYQLVIKARGKVMLSMLISILCYLVVVSAVALFVPYIPFMLVAFVLFVFLFLNFCIRMETVYFETDKIDREDLLLSYKRL